MTKNTSKSFILHKDSLSILDKMEDKQAGQLFKAIYYYQINNRLPEDIDPVLDLLATTFINQFKRDQEKYEEKCRKNKENAKKRWNATACDGIQTNAKHAHSDSDSDSDSKKDSKLIDKQFEEFYNKYGKKKSPSDVKNKLKTALKKDSFKNIMSGLDSYIKNRSKDSQFWKYPATWLNQECWKDEYNQSKSNREQHTTDLINKMMNDTLINKIEVTHSNKAKLFMTKDNFYKYNSFSNDLKEKILNSLKNELGVNGLEYNF
jgi:hypothetical protein